MPPIIIIIICPVTDFHAVKFTEVKEYSADS